MSLIEKVRLPKMRPPEANPKEKAAWAAFVKFAEEMGTTDNEVSPLVVAELDRLCARGNPIALRFKERLAITRFQPRKADEPPVPAPEKRRISMVKWGKPGLGGIPK